MATKRYLYDGTADALFSAIALILEEERELEHVVLAEREQTLFDEGFFIATNVIRAESLFARLRHRAPNAAHTVSTFMLSEKVEMASSLLRYISLAFTHGDKVNGYFTHPSVREIVAIAKKAGGELHRMKGLLRFEKLADGAYLAKMESSNNILQPLAHHFRTRLAAQDWFLYDVKRRAAACWSAGSLRFGTIEQFVAPALSEDEKKVQALWRSFFKTISIAERKNPRLQQSHLPMKYWKYLTEKQSGD